MLDTNHTNMPMDLNIKFAPNPDNNELNCSNSFARLLGCLQFISNSTRPDISFTVNKLAAYTANLGLQHHGAIKWILWYLAGTKTLGVTYGNTPNETDNDSLFHGYADATFVNANDHKCTTGYVFLGSGGAITWKLKKQTMIALSSMEVEYVALSEAGCEATWLRNLYGKLGFPQNYPTIIKGNNEGSVVLTHNPQFHQQSKHITLCHHWVQGLITDKILDIQNCHDPEQTVDVLTKALPRPKFTQHRDEMGIQLIL